MPPLRVAITGVAGRLGAAISKALKKDARVDVVAGLDVIAGKEVTQTADLATGSFSLPGCDVVVHAAALPAATYLPPSPSASCLRGCLLPACACVPCTRARKKSSVLATCALGALSFATNASLVALLAPGGHGHAHGHAHGAGGEQLTLALSPFNHAPRELTLGQFDALWRRHCKAMRVQHAAALSAAASRDAETRILTVELRLLCAELFDAEAEREAARESETSALSIARFFA